ncbi:hypothetical protein PVW48_05400 [Dinoroseobacter sp. PD6]|uniref:hypothetical protein n=1 Tax=Dinoroseobacter sp. PD6 TaxID=3028384 RepID=UPI00237B4AD8|nr:hypothetical protein [Dinoroseobacter sp. PD6]MDD9716169.1 hypothetical protein [Dinoroseobacter sp. PD6]
MTRVSQYLTLAAGSAVVLLAAAKSAAAPDLNACTRTTHISHGGEDGHRDLSAGRVMYRVWWSQEGTYSDYVVAECATGRALVTRAAEERMRARLPFDRTPAVTRVLERHAQRDPIFFDLDRLADDLAHTGRDTRIEMPQAEPCACAAVYPQAGAAWTPYAETAQ